MRRAQERPPSQRQLRVGEVIRHAIADLLQRGAIHDPVLETRVITIPEVAMTPDLKLATVYVEPLGGADAEATVAALTRNARWIRGQVAKAVNLRQAPELRFRHDTRFAQAAHVDEVLRRPQVARDLGGAKPEESD